MQENLRRELRLLKRKELHQLHRTIPALYFRRKVSHFKYALDHIPPPLRLVIISAMFMFAFLLILPAIPMTIPVSVGAGLSIGIWFY
jgi:hypothetical protein